MEIFTLIILLFIVLLLSIATFVLAAGLFLSAFGWVTTRVPFVPVRQEVVDRIIETLELKENSVLYDLGSGDGRILFAGAKKFPRAKFIGIEKAPLPFLISKSRLFRHKGANVSIISKSFFDTSLRNATHIFAYLSPHVMDELLPKLERELSPGTRLVACDFVFSKRAPNMEIDLGREKFKLAQKLYVYVF